MGHHHARPLLVFLMLIFAIARSVVEGHSDYHTSMIPNLLLIGQPKAGTSAVAEFLFKNGVCRPKVFPGEPHYYAKEVHFFSVDARFARGPAFYADRFRHCREKVWAMDATPLVFSQAPRVRAFYESLGTKAYHPSKNLHIIMMLREPVSRALSLYNHLAFEWHEQGNASTTKSLLIRPDQSMMSFEEFAERLPSRTARGKFDNFAPVEGYLEEWLSFIDPKKLLLLSYDEARKNPHKTTLRLQQFLNITPVGKLPRSNKKDAPSKIRRVPCRTREMLETNFQAGKDALLAFLLKRHGPPSEQRPFQMFHRAGCQLRGS